VFGPIKRAQSPGGAGASGAAATAKASLPRPSRLLTNAAPCGTVLSWDTSPGATRYRVLRAEYRAVELNVASPPVLPNGQVMSEAMPVPAAPGSGTPKRVLVAGKYVAIGTTTKTSFVDRTAKRGARYDYEVVAVGAAGETSQPSNVAAVPSQLPKATFTRLNSTIRQLRGGNQKLLGLAAAARTTWTAKGPSASLKLLDQLSSTVGVRRAGARDAGAVGEVQDAILRLERRAGVPAACSG
jgi:hypothetical protein